MIPFRSIPPGPLCLLLAVLVHAGGARAQDIDSLVRDAAYNEARAHKQESGWAYRIERSMRGQVVTEEQVDTAEGPVHRLEGIDGKPLSREEKDKEARRIGSLLGDPRQQAKAKAASEKDELQLVHLLQQLPASFVFRVEQRTPESLVLAFQPRPDAPQSGIESRVAQALEGELTIDLPPKRITAFRGRLFRRVEFGYGILGAINQGGTFSISRAEVLPHLWKTVEVDIDVSGRFSFFATIARQQKERRSEFRKIPDTLTAAQGYRWMETSF